MARIDKDNNLFPSAGSVKAANNYSPPAADSWPEPGQPETSLVIELNHTPLLCAANTPGGESFVTRQISGNFPPFERLVFSDPVETFSDEELWALQLAPRPEDPDFMQPVPESARSNEQLRQARAHLAARTAALERNLTQNTDRLAESDRAMETMCSALADNLREPLRSMTGFSQLLLADNGGSLNGNGKDYLQRVARAAERLDHLIESLLKYGQLSREEPVCETISAETAACMVIGEIIGTIAAQRAEVHTQRPLPQVRANPVLLRQVFGHLIDNALKFVPPEVAPQVRIRSEVGPAMVRIYVEDNGIGVPPEHHERIFGLFQRLSDAYPGTGVGLALVRKAVERMGGQTGVESEPGKGCRFWFELPKPR